MLFVPLTVFAQTVPVAPEPPAGPALEVIQMAALEVNESRATVADTVGLQDLQHYGESDLEESGAFDLNEFFDTLPEGAEGDEQLVLIDGQPVYLDPSMLDFSMIETIEVSLEGSMPQHGAYARGRVINIRLKQDYSGRKLSARTQFSEAGGGSRQNARFNVTEMHGKLRLMVAIEANQSSALLATDRPFSANQDHRAIGGSDLRLEWGSPAVVQAVDGELDLLSASGGVPVAAALVPEGASTTPALTEFLPPNPALGSGAQGQRRFDSAAYRQLARPSSGYGGTVDFNYRLSPLLNFTVNVSHRRSDSDRIGPPPVSPVSAATVVPAAYSPFGEDVAVGLVHVGFGPTRESQSTRKDQFGLKLDGRLSDTWRWNAGYGFEENRSFTVVTDLDDAAFAAALTAADPARRFNPFVDDAALPLGFDRYTDLTTERSRRQSVRTQRIDLRTHGELLTLPSGPVQLSLQAKGSARDTARETLNPDNGADRFIATSRRSAEGSGNLDVPLIDRERPRPGLHKLNLQGSVAYRTSDADDRSQRHEFGLSWAPLSWISVRARRAAETEHNSALIELREDSLTGETLTDPRRGFTSTTDVQIQRRESIVAVPEESARTQVGITLQPPALTGLRFSADYATRERDPLFQDELRAQDIINNESAFPGRVVRAAPTAEDLAAGQPGRILSVDTTGGEAGSAVTEDLRLSLDYRLPEQPFGRLRIKVDARHTLDSRYELQPGVPFINEGGSRFNPPDWRLGGHVSWSLDGWSATLRGNHTGAIATNIVDEDLPAYTEFKFNVGYRWRQPLWGDFGRGTRLSANIDNLFDREPPFADNLNGFRGGSALGRAVSLSVDVPL
ncbi:TonB-dependent receptor [Actomonas aquatica]|uniref:TonB-dependent receptor n=1 Tax=Actomonas aquatica TaxID=2866162 RepID=A0ABZ1C9K2_9BACT|nr:TonB-dependent receptor [Opitutus sp. WL0086]WRQ88279.1 TonB-dependent receptor [Opitutus sp. WL0086]